MRSLPGPQEWDIPCGCNHDVRFDTLIIASPVPKPNSLRAVRYRSFHVQILGVRLLIANDHVNVVFTSKTMISDGKQSVNIGR